MESLVNDIRALISRKFYQDRKRYYAQNQTNRENWLKRTLLSIPNGYRILDAGAGELQYKKFCKHLVYVSQDFAKYNGKGNGFGMQTGERDQSQVDIESDITDIPESDGAFDAVMCIEVLEHLTNPISALQELTRLLKKKGILILTAPFCSLTHYSPYHFVTGFNLYFYKKHLTDLGYEILSIEENGNFFEYLAQEILRIPLVAERYCNMHLRKYESLAISIIIKMLQRLTTKDTGSSELLCFGYHVLAQKK